LGRHERKGRLRGWWSAVSPEWLPYYGTLIILEIAGFLVPMEKTQFVVNFCSLVKNFMRKFGVFPV
jgi:hypothetical protein